MGLRDIFRLPTALSWGYDGGIRGRCFERNPILLHEYIAARVTRFCTIVRFASPMKNVMGGAAGSLRVGLCVYCLRSLGKN